MPWKISSKRSECSGYAVVDDKGKVVGCHQTRAQALAQQRALYASEANKSVDEGNERSGKRRNEMHKQWSVEPNSSGGFDVVGDEGNVHGTFPTEAEAQAAADEHNASESGDTSPDMCKTCKKNKSSSLWGGAFGVISK